MISSSQTYRRTRPIGRRLRVRDSGERFQSHYAVSRGRMPPKVARLAGLGAFGACAAFVALYLFVSKISSPSPTGGMMPALSAVTWISLGLVLLALIGVHILFGRQLLDL